MEQRCLRPGRLGEGGGRRRPDKATTTSSAIADFLDIPARSSKPREHGITHVIDRGLSVAEVDGLLEVAGPSVDIVKLGWGTALVSANLEAEARALRGARDPGGARRHAHRDRDPPGSGGRAGRLAARAGAAPRRDLRRDDRARGRRQARADRTPRPRSSPCSPRWAARTSTSSWPRTCGSSRSNAIWTAGAWKVIAEARESGTAGIYRANGEPRTGLIDSEMIGEDGVMEMVEIFETETRQRLRRLAAGNQSIATLVREMHTLKGAAGYRRRTPPRRPRPNVRAGGQARGSVPRRRYQGDRRCAGSVPDGGAGLEQTPRSGLSRLLTGSTRSADWTDRRPFGAACGRQDRPTVPPRSPASSPAPSAPGPWRARSRSSAAPRCSPAP